MLSHVSSPRLSSGHSGPVLTLSVQLACLPVQPPLTAGGHELLLCWDLWLGVYSVGFFSFFFFFPVKLSFEVPKLPTDLLVRGFPGVWKLLLFYDSLPRTGLHLELSSVFLSFIFCSTSFQRQWAALLGVWCPPPEFRSCFVVFAHRSNDLLMNLWGRKWSPHPIPPPS